MTITDYDDISTRCPMLGHPVPFSYCRSLQAGMPCRKVLDCWYQQFDVQRFIEAVYTPEQIASFLGPPKPKISQIVELIEKAKKSRS